MKILRSFFNRRLFSLQLPSHRSAASTISAPTYIHREDQVPKQSDVIIVGGGLVGWSVAFWLRWMSKFTVTLIERDPTYTRSASILGLASVRQQFSEPENIQMSLFCSDFIRNIKKYLTCEGLYILLLLMPGDTNVDIGYNPQGCLLLANVEQAHGVKENLELQLDLGAKVKLLSKTELSKRWPWLSLDDVELGCYGYENEGWFDPWLLLKALRAKSHQLGVNYVVGEVYDFESSPYMTTITFPERPLRPPVSNRQLREVKILRPDGSTASITFSMVVNAAGPWTQNIARLAEIGEENIPMAVPVELRTRNIYAVKQSATSQRYFDPRQEIKAPGLDAPFLIDPDRLFMERHGLTGEFFVYSDHPDLEKHHKMPPNNDFRANADMDFYHNFIAPRLAHRIPALKDAEVTSSWTSICDYNTVDQNLIIGHHPFHVNMYFCNGSSGHSNQHAIAIGHSLAEHILYGHYKTIDLTRFSFDRFYLNNPIQEVNAF